MVMDITHYDPCLRKSGKNILIAFLRCEPFYMLLQSRTFVSSLSSAPVAAVEALLVLALALQRRRPSAGRKLIFGIVHVFDFRLLS